MQLPNALLAAILVVAAGNVAASDTAVASDIVVENAKMRYIPGDRPSAGYMTMTNPGNTPVALVGAHTEAYARVELHRSVMLEGTMRMEMQKAIDIPPGDAVVLMPGDYHLMFMGAEQPVAVGDQLGVTLSFSSGHETEVHFEVVGAADEI